MQAGVNYPKLKLKHERDGDGNVGNVKNQLQLQLHVKMIHNQKSHLEDLTAHGKYTQTAELTWWVTGTGGGGSDSSSHLMAYIHSSSPHLWADASRSDKPLPPSL